MYPLNRLLLMIFMIIVYLTTFCNSPEKEKNSNLLSVCKDSLRRADGFIHQKNKIGQLQSLCNEQKHNLQFFLVLIVVIACLLLILYGSNRKKFLLEKNDKLKVENKRLLLEQKTLQLQLNPHFIYNCIANLQGLISGNEKNKAENYLIAFSKLMRNVLELNRQDYINLSQEIESLENYIHLQKMRFANKFDYHIYAGKLDIENIFIPPMILQPFVENTIEHGFNNINYKGFLQIILKELGDNLLISISDNGRGLYNKKNADKKSLSRSIIKERLKVIFKHRASFETSENTLGHGKGYQVDLFIPIIKQ